MMHRGLQIMDHASCISEATLIEIGVYEVVTQNSVVFKVSLNLIITAGSVF